VRNRTFYGVPWEVGEDELMSKWAQLARVGGAVGWQWYPPESIQVQCTRQDRSAKGVVQEGPHRRWRCFRGADGDRGYRSAIDPPTKKATVTGGQTVPTTAQATSEQTASPHLWRRRCQLQRRHQLPRRPHCAVALSHAAATQPATSSRDSGANVVQQWPRRLDIGS